MNEEEEIAKRGFAVIDKRGQNNPVQETPTPETTTPDSAPVQERKWESVGYECGNIPIDQNASMVVGLAVGSDFEQNVFTAQYGLGVITVQYPKIRWEGGWDWTIEARRRLDTFLQCPCSPKTGPCQYHYRATGPRGWQKEDIDRIREEGRRAVPKAIELLSQTERARQQAQRILAPRR